jgi:hypothetical protein
MRRDLFDQLVESVRQMKAIEARRLRPGRVTRIEDLVQGGSQARLRVVAAHPEARLSVTTNAPSRGRRRERAAV